MSLNSLETITSTYQPKKPFITYQNRILHQKKFNDLDNMSAPKQNSLKSIMP